MRIRRSNGGRSQYGRGILVSLVFIFSELTPKLPATNCERNSTPMFLPAQLRAS
jgi:hypothetical protein